MQKGLSRTQSPANAVARAPNNPVTVKISPQEHSSKKPQFQAKRPSVADLRMAFERPEDASLEHSHVTTLPKTYAASATYTRTVDSHGRGEISPRQRSVTSMDPGYHVRNAADSKRSSVGLPLTMARLMAPIQPGPVPHSPFRMSAPPAIPLPKSKSSKAVTTGPRRTQTDKLQPESVTEERDLFSTPLSHFDSSPRISPERADQGASGSSPAKTLHQRIDAVDQTPVRPEPDIPQQSCSPSLRRRASKVADLRKIFDQRASDAPSSPHDVSPASPTTMQRPSTVARPSQLLGQPLMQNPSSPGLTNTARHHKAQRPSGTTSLCPSEVAGAYDGATGTPRSPLKDKIGLFETLSQTSTASPNSIAGRRRSHDSLTRSLRRYGDGGVNKRRATILHPKSRGIWRRLSRSLDPGHDGTQGGPRGGHRPAWRSQDHADTAPFFPGMRPPAPLELRPWGIHSLQRQGGASVLSN